MCGMSAHCFSIHPTSRMCSPHASELSAAISVSFEGTYHEREHLDSLDSSLVSLTRPKPGGYGWQSTLLSTALAPRPLWKDQLCDLARVVCVCGAGSHLGP